MGFLNIWSKNGPSPASDEGLISLIKEPSPSVIASHSPPSNDIMEDEYFCIIPTILIIFSFVNSPL